MAVTKSIFLDLLGQGKFNKMEYLKEVKNCNSKHIAYIEKNFVISALIHAIRCEDPEYDSKKFTRYNYADHDYLSVKNARKLFNDNPELKNLHLLEKLKEDLSRIYWIKRAEEKRYKLEKGEKEVRILSYQECLRLLSNKNGQLIYDGVTVITTKSDWGGYMRGIVLPKVFEKLKQTRTIMQEVYLNHKGRELWLLNR